MFERFTDRARRALVLAQDEARELGHDFIGPEHLLLGLFQAGGVAAAALNQVGVDLEAARRRAAEAISSRPAAHRPGKLPFSPRAKKTLELSLREALRLGHKYIGTEHVLLGILRVAEKDPGAVGSVIGVDAERLRDRVIALLNGNGPDSQLESTSDLAFWNRPSEAFADALHRARELAGPDPVTTGHLITAVLGDPKSQGARALAALGVTEDGFAAALAQVPLDDTSDGRPRFMEVKIGETTTTIEDPDLIDALRGMPEDQLRTTFVLLKQVIKKRGGPGAAA